MFIYRSILGKNILLKKGAKQMLLPFKLALRKMKVEVLSKQKLKKIFSMTNSPRSVRKMTSNH